MTRTIPREVTQADIGWLSGIIDGEGSICIVRPKKINTNKILYGVFIVGSDYSLMIKSINIINKFNSEGGEPLKLAKKVYRIQTFKQTKGCWQLCIRKQDTIKNVLNACLPHLTEKKPKALKLLNFLNKHKKGTMFKEGEVDEYLNFTPVETERATLERDEATVRTHK